MANDLTTTSTSTTSIAKVVFNYLCGELVIPVSMRFFNTRDDTLA